MLKQLVILSGKGGTGKTSLTAAFAHLAYAGPARRQAALVDADVDAANLELALRPQRGPAHTFYGGAAAQINPARCDGCGACYAACRFDALIPQPGGGYAVDPIACEGCAACYYVCPSDAVRLEPQIAGAWFLSASRFGPLAHAELLPAQENSGKLVTLVKQQGRTLALQIGADLLLVDGPPGIGCPAIAAASGADLALLTTEPTAAGLHDLARALEMTRFFRLPVVVCVNKADLYPAGATEIEAFCRANDLALLGRIPYDETVCAAMVQGEPVTAYRPNSPAAQALRALWQAVAERL